MYIVRVPSQADLASGRVAVNGTISVLRVGANVTVVDVTVAVINATPVELPLLDDAHANLPFRRRLAAESIGRPANYIGTVSSWLHAAVASVLRVPADVEGWKTPWLHRIFAGWLAGVASPELGCSSGNSSWACEADSAAGSAAWYATWESRFATSEPLSPGRRFAANLLRTLIFLTTPHDHGGRTYSGATQAPLSRRDRGLLSTGPATYTAWAFAATLVMPCALPAGAQRLVVGDPSLDGENVTFTCPTILGVPSCGAWDTAAAEWGLGHCFLVAVTPKGVLCSCVRLTYASFATRFSNVAAAQRGIFSGAALLGDTSTLFKYPTVFIIVGSIAVRGFRNRCPH